MNYYFLLCLELDSPKAKSGEKLAQKIGHALWDHWPDLPEGAIRIEYVVSQPGSKRMATVEFASTKKKPRKRKPHAR